MRQSILFNVSTYAKRQVSMKRERKGLSELTPRETNPYALFMKYSLVACTAKTLFAPLERLRII